MQLPDADERRQIVLQQARAYQETEPGCRVEIDSTALELFVENLSGLDHGDCRRLARAAIVDDGALTRSDLQNVMQAKYQLLNQSGLLSFEYDTARFKDIAGFGNVKRWLAQRRSAFTTDHPDGLDPPKGILLLGIQGCGKSLAAKAAASALGIPLLRLDFGSLYNKYHGETERNLRDALATAEVLSPCVLWLDEIEKGIATEGSDSGTSRRVLGTLLTWMAERRSKVLIVATANNIEALPGELIRKGRFDEIFFVDLPSDQQREQIFEIHLARRGLDPKTFDLAALGAAVAGFSGAEIEQAVVAALYAAHAENRAVTQAHLMSEARRTRPLSVVMAERVTYLRNWAHERTVSAD
jgi:SpoVK/Ycf46/Vps4 family AAA+-type ATPase